MYYIILYTFYTKNIYIIYTFYTKNIYILYKKGVYKNNFKPKYWNNTVVDHMTLT